MNSPAQAVKTGHKSTKYAQDGDDAPCVPFTAHLFISEENEAKLVFKAGQRTLDRAALRYSPPSLRGAADDPSLRNQLQQLFLSEDADRPSNWALKSRDNSCSSPPLTLQTHTTEEAQCCCCQIFVYHLSAQSFERNVKHPHHLPDLTYCTKKNQLSRTHSRFIGQWTGL